MKVKIKLEILLVLAFIFTFVSTARAMFNPEENKRKFPGIPRQSITHVKAQAFILQSGEQSKAVSKRAIHIPSLQFNKPKLNAQQREVIRQAMSANPGMKVRFNTRHNVPVYMKGNPLYVPQSSAQGLSVEKKSPEQVSIDAINHFKYLFKLSNPSRELVPKRTIKSQKIHVRLAQYYNGIPVWGKELTVHLDSANRVYLIEGHILPTPSNIPSSPRIQADVAVSKAASDLGVSSSLASPSSQLVIMEDDAGIVHLAWKVELNKGWIRWRYFVDATNGLIIKKYSLVMNVSVSGSGTDLFGTLRNFHVWQESGTYYLADASLPMSTEPPNFGSGSRGQGNVILCDANHTSPDKGNFSPYIITSNSSTSWDPTAVSALYNLETTLLYYYNTFGRRCIDNNNMNVLGIVHVGNNLANAFWDGSSNAMFFGDGDGTQFDSLAKALDVVAHELTHGVTQYTANLEYQFQSGALNEAFSDIFGTMVDRDDWTVGEDIVLVPPYNLRNLEDPHNSLQQPAPAHMNEYQELPIDNDNGGVHINATIPAHAAYLIASAIGKDKAERIFYKTLTEHLTPTSQFWDFCSALSEAAEELYGANSQEVQACQNACVQVGITESSQPPGGGGGGGGGEVPPMSTGDYVLFFFYEYNQSYDEYVLYLGEITPDGQAYYLSETPALYRRPAPYYQDPNYAFFVGSDYTVYMANVTSDTYEEYSVNVASGEVWSIATSPGNNYLVFTSKYASDNRIYLWEIGSSTIQYVEIRFTPPDSSIALSSYDPDVIAVDLSGRYIFFDCINEISITTGGNSSSYQFWNIGLVDLTTGKTFMLFTPPPEGINIGNPATAQTRGYLLAYDVASFDTFESATYIANLKTGRSGQVWYGEISVNGDISGYPSFNGDDTYIYLQNVGYSSVDIIRVPLFSNGDVWYGDVNNAQVVMEDSYVPMVYRPGARSVGPIADVSPTTLNFGSVAVGYSKTMQVTISNKGNYPLTFSGATLSDSRNFDVRAVHTTIQPGEYYQITVVFSPAFTGSCSATLTIYTDDPQHRTVTVSLQGIGNEGSSNYADRIQQVYIAYYGRPADPAGLDYWVSQLAAAGGDLRAIIQAFGNSQEFTRRYGGLTNEQLIDTIYQQMFNRAPDEAGKSFYLGKLESGEMTLQTITLNVLDGATGTDKTTIENKLEVANYFTQKVREGCPYPSEGVGVEFLQGVDYTEQSVEDAKDAIDRYCAS